MKILSYIPHGINSEVFFPIHNDHPDWNEFEAMKRDFKEKNQVDFVIFWNSRNIRRKQPADIILAFRQFCDGLPKHEADKCCLFMKTHIQDQHGTDLMAVKKQLCPDYKVIFNQEIVHSKVMNFFYNLADVTVNFSSAEGFGLGIAESLMAGTMVIAPVHGGLQDQMRFTDAEGNLFNESNSRKTVDQFGKWVYALFPRARQLQGSIPTPYIFDYVCDAADLSEGIRVIYNMPSTERNINGLLGREWMLSDESKMSSKAMCAGFIKSVTTLLETWKPKPNFSVQKITKEISKENNGLLH